MYEAVNTQPRDWLCLLLLTTEGYDWLLILTAGCYQHNTMLAYSENYGVTI